jgi:hypothetical protein
MAAAGSNSFAAKNTFGAAGESSFAPGQEKATVVGNISDYSNVYYCDFNGFVISAKATTDAAIKIGDVVWVQKTTSGYIITGTA